MRVRFAESPSGLLHLGGVHAALFNWLFARSQGGKFILRLVDADRAAADEDAERGIYVSLKWLGLDWDEGPVSYQKFSEPGMGERGPYRQSERAEIYSRHLELLRDQGRAYPCFCTGEELEARRRELARQGAPYVYSGSCASLSEAEQEERMKTHPHPLWRFRARPKDGAWRDQVRGEVPFVAAQLGDFIIKRRNGQPAHNFAAVVDDHLMEISHVIRGEDQISNTPRQLMLYEAFGWEPPRFAHLPLITGEDRKPLSKCPGPGSLDDLYASGFLPAAIVNYLALLGWSSPTGEEVLAAEEIVRGFSLERVNKSSSVFDLGKLTWLNGKHLRATSTRDLLTAVRPYLAHAGYRIEDGEEQRLTSALNIIKDRLELLTDAVCELKVFLDEKPELTPEADEWLKRPGSCEVLAELERALTGTGDFVDDEVKTAIQKAGAAAGARGRALYLPIRAAVSGKLHGPELVPMIALLGRERVRQRIHAAIDSDRKA